LRYDPKAKREGKMEKDELWANLVETYRIMREATFQGHSAHWDRTMQGGAGCPACIETNEKRKEADKLWDLVSSAVHGLILAPSAPKVTMEEIRAIENEDNMGSKFLDTDDVIDLLRSAGIEVRDE
jgi:hypothetical protein